MDVAVSIEELLVFGLRSWGYKSVVRALEIRPKGAV